MRFESLERETVRRLGLVSALSVGAVAVHGFHPYAEDGGLYVAGIKRVLDPKLFPVRPEFVLAHLRFSPFAGFVAGLVRWTNVPLEWMLLLLYFASIWGTLWAGGMVARRCTPSETGFWGAVCLLACWLTLPIAGTSLILLDPYVTSRSLSTPLTLLALAWTLDALEGRRRSGWLVALALGLSVVHPLMAGYGLAAVLMLVVCGQQSAEVRRWGVAGLGVAAIAVAGAIQALAPAESAAYVQAAMTRFYWFPARWQWYELVGLVAPLAVIAGLTRHRPTRAWLNMGRAAVASGATSMAVALAFCRPAAATHLVARLQPLRSFQVVYEVMILLLGAWIGERWLARWRWRWALAIGVAAAVMFAADRTTYQASNHVEWPGERPRNAWAMAFVWARDHTPRDALFALPSHYITMEGEDAQCFRGIAERSALADYSKDGGEASITPSLAAEWVEGQGAQDGLDEASDEQRAAKLLPLGVSWIVLKGSSQTIWNCPYRNGTVKVCRLP